MTCNGDGTETVVVSKAKDKWVKISECDNEHYVSNNGDSYTIEFTCDIDMVSKLGDNFIQNFHLGRYIVGYMVGNLVLRRRISGAVKRDFRTYIQRYTSPKENFEYGYTHFNALLIFSLKKTVKMYFVVPIRPAAASCIKALASCINPLVSQ